MPNKKNQNGKSNTQLLDEAEKAQGMVNVAANLAADNIPAVAENTGNKRGRKPSQTVTLASFTAHVKAGLAGGDKGIEFTPPAIVNNAAGVPTIQPMRHISPAVLSIDDTGSLSIVRYQAVNQGHISTEVLAGPVPADVVLEFVKTYKPVAK